MSEPGGQEIIVRDEDGKVKQRLYVQERSHNQNSSFDSAWESGIRSVLEHELNTRLEFFLQKIDASIKSSIDTHLPTKSGEVGIHIFSLQLLTLER
jgi:hypothetical protein